MTYMYILRINVRAASYSVISSCLLLSLETSMTYAQTTLTYEWKSPMESSIEVPCAISPTSEFYILSMCAFGFTLSFTIPNHSSGVL